VARAASRELPQAMSALIGFLQDVGTGITGRLLEQGAPRSCGFDRMRSSRAAITRSQLRALSISEEALKLADETKLRHS
jgi:hypothetical protein